MASTKLLIQHTLRPVIVEPRHVPMLPRSIWACNSRGHTFPVCRFNGLTSTLIRVIGLLEGMDEDLFIVPRNGDHFDCTAANALSCVAVPKDYRIVRAALFNPTPGIVVKDGLYQVILEANGKPRWFGTSSDLKTAKRQLRAAKKQIKADQTPKS